jgi:hypothetical protein
MKRARRLLLVGVAVALAWTNLFAQQNLSDPHEVLNRYFEAAGGLDRLKAESTAYFEAEISVAGMQGTFKSWFARPDRLRNDIDLGILKMIQADNGEYEWTLDSNGKLQKITNPDEASIKRREVRKRIAEYEYADRGSETFEIIFEGTDSVDAKECYAIRIENIINNDVLTYFINTDNFLLEKSVSLEANNSNDQFFADYRLIDGLMVPFWNKQVAHMTGQEQEIILTEYVSNPPLDPTIFDPPGEGEKDYRFAQGNSAENIPMVFAENHIFIPVIVDCRERFWILDTGAALSVVSEKFAAELRLEKQGDLKGMGAGGTVNISFTELPPFSLTGIEFDKQMVAVVDLTELNRVICMEIAGILGFDFLSRFVTKVDFANENVSFYEPETFEYKGEGNEIPLHIRENVFTVKATLDGEHSGNWLFDLGASSTSLHGAYALREGYSDVKGVVRIARGAAHAFKMKKIRSETVDFAGYTVREPIVSFPYGGSDTTFTADRIGTLGNTLFRNFVIFCDYAGERLIVEKGEKFDGIYPEDHSGMQLTRAEDDDIAVLHVADDTPAAKSGFREGDILKSINGIDIGRLNGLIAIRSMLCDEPGTKYKFVVVRDGIEKKLNIKLAKTF